jgi:hypothetical protein
MGKTTPDPIDHRRWTGDVERQKAELKRLLVGLVLAVAILLPFAILIGTWVSKAIGL